MSYSEENGQVVLKMSREDYDSLLLWLGMAHGSQSRTAADWNRVLSFMNRLNSGNQHYTPYQVEEKKP